MNLSWGRVILTCFVCCMLSTTALAESFSIKSLSIDSTQKNLLIQGTNPTYQNIKISRHVLSNPLRVIYDIYDAKLINPKNSAILNNPNVTEVRIAQFSTAPYVVRIGLVLSLLTLVLHLVVINVKYNIAFKRKKHESNKN